MTVYHVQCKGCRRILPIRGVESPQAALSAARTFHDELMGGGCRGRLVLVKKLQVRTKKIRRHHR